ncbi:unnamed protein product [Urochloa humidicola]
MVPLREPTRRATFRAALPLLPPLALYLTPHPYALPTSAATGGETDGEGARRGPPIGHRIPTAPSVLSPRIHAGPATTPLAPNSSASKKHLPAPRSAGKAPDRRRRTEMARGEARRQATGSRLLLRSSAPASTPLLPAGPATTPPALTPSTPNSSASKKHLLVPRSAVEAPVLWLDRVFPSGHLVSCPCPARVVVGARLDERLTTRLLLVRAAGPNTNRSGLACRSASDWPGTRLVEAWNVQVGRIGDG